MRTIGSFETVKPLLDDAHNRVPDAPIERDKLIRDAMKLLSDTYEDSQDAQAIDFRDHAIQYAYLYKYMAAHANFVFKAMNARQTRVQRHFAGNSLNIAVIGGGPGSEALGVAMLADDYDSRPKLKCVMCSPQACWQATWDKLKLTLSPKINVDFRHVAFDVTADSSTAATSICTGAELFFLVKVLSEVKNAKPAVEQCLVSLFAHAPAGSHFVFIDNLDDDVYRWFDGLVQQHSLTIEHSEDNPEFRIIDGEQRGDLKEHIREIEGWHKPMMKAKLAIRLVAKA